MSQRFITTGKTEVPEQLKYILNMISLTESPQIVGSAKYAEHKYPGDIDVFESAVSTSGREAALFEFAGLFRNIGKLLSIEPTVKLADFKCGHDSRFKYDDQMSKREFLMHLNAKKLICNKELKLHLQALEDDDEDMVDKFLHNLMVVRWELPELIMGRKKLRGDVEITLEDGLSMNAITKIDVVTWFSSRLQYVEVFYLIGYTEKGRVKTYHELKDYARGMAADVVKFSRNNPLKTMKRLWGLSRFYDCANLMDALNPVFSSDAAALNQIKADIEVIKMLRQPLDKILIQCLEFKKRLFDHLEPSEYQEFDGLIEHIYILWGYHQMKQKFDYAKLHEVLDKIEEILQPKIDERSWEFYDTIKQNTVFCDKIVKLISQYEN
jgi:hypothetical protein